jgi:RNA polymerase primary sigma factor
MLVDPPICKTQFSQMAMDESLDHELLSKEDEFSLIKKAQAGDRESRDKIISMNQRLVFKIARKYYIGGLQATQEMSDLMQWGNMGLLEALDKFDLKRGHKFSTYAVWWVRAYIHRYGFVNSSEFSISCGFSEKMNKVRHVFAKLAQSLGRTPTQEELITATGFSEEIIKESLVVSQVTLKLDAPEIIAHDESRAMRSELIEDSAPGTEEMAFANCEVSEIQKILSTLPDNYGFVIKHHFGIECVPMTQEQIGKKLGITGTRVQQIEQMALYKIKEMLSMPAEMQ